MKPHHLLRAVRLSKPAALMLAFLASAVALSAVGIVSSTAQSTQKEERELEEIIPAHLPIKVKVKNLQNEKWEHDLEIEVKNTGNKPIYFISLSFVMPEVKLPGDKILAFPLRYGREELVDFTVLAGPDDVPILPGATHVFKLAEENLEAWEFRKAQHPKPKKLRLRINYLNFGDGTGFLGPTGMPVDSKKKSASAAGGCQDVGDAHSGRPPTLFSSTRVLFSPANFLPVNFSPASFAPSKGAHSTARDVCCPDTPCGRYRATFYTCHCRANAGYAESVGCHETQYP